MPSEKQKILFKGKVIKEEEQWKALEIAEGAQFMLMGVAEGKEMNLEKITQSAKFIEEMTLEERAKFAKEKTGVDLVLVLADGCIRIE